MKRLLWILAVLAGLAVVAAFIYSNPQPVSVLLDPYFQEPVSLLGTEMRVPGGEGLPTAPGFTQGGAPQRLPRQVPLGQVLVGVFILGFFTSWLLDLKNWFTRRFEMQKLRKTNERLQKEVHSLRTAPLEGDLSPALPTGQKEAAPAAEEQA